MGWERRKIRKVAKVQVASAFVSTWQSGSRDRVVVGTRGRFRPAGDLAFGWLPHSLSTETKIPMSFLFGCCVWFGGS